MRKRTSILWTISTEKLREIISSSLSVKETLAWFGLENKGHNYRTLRARLNKEGITTSHFVPNGRIPSSRKPLKSMLTINSTHNRGNLKKRLMEAGFLEKRCSECGLTDNWNGKPITLQLDHINGISNDNRLENLRILCPNCHSQTITFSGRHLISRKKRYYCSCGRPKQKKSARCKTCSAKTQTRHYKIDWPSTQELQLMVDTLGYSATGRKLGVSDNAVRKRLRTRSQSPIK